MIDLIHQYRANVVELEDNIRHYKQDSRPIPSKLFIDNKKLIDLDNIKKCTYQQVINDLEKLIK
jgi:hypothetical protein